MRYVKKYTCERESIIKQMNFLKKWFNLSLHSKAICKVYCGQCAKKVVFDSLGLVDFAIGLVDFAIGLVSSFFNLPNGQVMFVEEFE